MRRKKSIFVSRSAVGLRIDKVEDGYGKEGSGARGITYRESRTRSSTLADTVDDRVRERPGTVIGRQAAEEIGDDGIGLVFVAE